MLRHVQADRTWPCSLQAHACMARRLCQASRSADVARLQAASAPHLAWASTFPRPWISPHRCSQSDSGKAARQASAVWKACSRRGMSLPGSASRAASYSPQRAQPVQRLPDCPPALVQLREGCSLQMGRTHGCSDFAHAPELWWQAGSPPETKSEQLPPTVWAEHTWAHRPRKSACTTVDSSNRAMQLIKKMSKEGGCS